MLVLKALDSRLGAKVLGLVALLVAFFFLCGCGKGIVLVKETLWLKPIRLLGCIECFVETVETEIDVGETVCQAAKVFGARTLANLARAEPVLSIA